MKTLPVENILKKIPGKVKTGAFVMVPTDNARRFKRAVIREIKNGIPRGMRRAVLIFGKGIAEFRARQIAHEIGAAIQKDSALDTSNPKLQFHIHTMSNISKQQIRKLVSRHIKKGQLNVFHNY